MPLGEPRFSGFLAQSICVEGWLRIVTFWSHATENRNMVSTKSPAGVFALHFREAACQLLRSPIVVGLLACWLAGLHKHRAAGVKNSACSISHVKSPASAVDEKKLGQSCEPRHCQEPTQADGGGLAGRVLASWG